MAVKQCVNVGQCLNECKYAAHGIRENYEIDPDDDVTVKVWL